MRQWFLPAAGIVLALVLVGVWLAPRLTPRRTGAPPAPAEPADPDIGFDYRAFVADHMELIGAGKADEAAAYLVAHATGPDAFPPAALGETRDKLAALSASAGRYDGHELVGYKAVSSRLYRFYAVLYFERTYLVAEYQVVKTPAGQWRLSNFGLSNSIDGLDKLTPMLPLRPPG